MNKPNYLNANFMVIPSDAKQIKRSLLVGIILVIITLITVPFADLQLTHSEPLLPIFIAINFLSELITAYIFFAQYKLSKDFPLLLLGLTYLYSGLITVPYLLTYPGVFHSTGLLGAGPQTSAWIWIYWHVGFPLGIIIYIGYVHSFKRKVNTTNDKRFLRVGIGLIISIVTIITLATTIAKSHLPILLTSDSYTNYLKFGYGFFVLVLNVLALVSTLIATSKNKSILNLWLCISVLACLLEVILTILAGGRYTLGWYVARMNSIVSALTIFFVFIVEITYLYQKIATSEMKLKELINIDGLTGIANRRYMDEYLKNQVSLHDQITFILFDIDDYKLFNAYYGHQMGDECLKLVAQKASNCLKEYEGFVARYGGEEFAVIIPNYMIEQGLQLSETIRKAIESLKIPHAGVSENAIVTCSFGISSIIVVDDLSIQKLIYQADLALYEAKRKGKNQSFIFKKGTQFRK